MNLFLVFFGYLIGSISPGYFFGRLVKRIDIRQFGNGNTGATNTYHVVGPVFGIITGIFDFLKTPAAYWLAVSGSKISPDLGILVGLAAVAGHVKPFYLSFKGGKGVASLLGLSLITILYTRSIFALVLVISTVVYSVAVSKSLIFTHPLRRLLKLSVLALPLGLIWLPKSFILPVIIVLLLFFVVFDMIRFLSPYINRRYLRLKIFAKQKEKQKFSGATLIFLSALIVFWLFPKEIAAFSFIVFLLGDTLAPLGQKLLSIPLLREKTLGGALIIFLVSFISGLFLMSLTPLYLAFPQILLASLLTATLDQFSFLMDDNLLVPVGTALILTVLNA